MAQIGQNGNLKVLVVKKGWNIMENDCLNPHSTLFQPFRTIRTFKSLLLGIVGPFWPFSAIWAIFGRPLAKFGGAPLFQIGPKTSNWTSHSPFHLHSTLFQPFGTTRTFKSPFWAFLANLGRFWGPLGQIWGHPASPNWFKIFDLYLPQPVPPSFHAVPTVWDHRSLQIAILANLGSFWAVFGPWRSQI